MVLAKRGFNVQVFEKRPPVGGDQAWVNRRSYYLLLDQRVVAALRAVGCVMNKLETHFKPCTGISLYKPNIAEAARHVDFPTNRTWFVERFQLLSFLLSEMERLFGASNPIAVHYNHAVVGLDVGGKRVTFLTPSGERHVGYELLIGADGGSSRIRTAMKGQVPGFGFTVDKSYERYVSLMLDVSRYNAIKPLDLKFYPANDWANPNPKSEPAGELTVVAFPNDRTMFHFALHKDAVPRYTTKQDRVKCNQLHGPSIILVGDAGHATTEKSGQGANSAIDDAHVLLRVLTEAEDLESVPAAFTKARLADVHTLYQFNRESLHSRGRHGFWCYPFLRDTNQFVVWGSLHKALPWLVSPPALTLALEDEPVPYSACKQEMDRHLAMSAGAVAVLAAVGLRWALSCLT
ncbi:hypothetical protein WJX72_001790 [[Myrmecia] bisecta]|uniref:FAD-binding domain-containing protein n=1 Tax=[Myrmecia] bisecta TaxID=41462 RepID=A0AAW1PRB6_9CHLO